MKQGRLQGRLGFNRVILMLEHHYVLRSSALTRTTHKPKTTGEVAADRE